MLIDWARRVRGAAAALVTLAMIASLPAAAAEPETLVYFGFHLTNTSLEETSPAELQRLKSLDDTFVEMIKAAPTKYRLIELPVAEIETIAKGPGIGNCNGCEIDVGKRLGATRVAWGEVQKVSNLILNINIYVEDTVNNRTAFVKSTDIRNNTDESWRRGIIYLLKNYLLAD